MLYLSVKIACLGWGSLIWDPKKLKIKKGDWKDDGPVLPIEFNRISNDKRVTLVIDEEGTRVNVLWKLMTVNNIKDAIKSLRERENCEESGIHFIATNDDNKKHYPQKLVILKWLKLKKLDGVVWTGLGFKNNEGEAKRMTYEYIKNHLAGLSYIEAKLAEQYVRKAPPQIRTACRERLETELGWVPIK